jgi:hypothetical protein
MEETGRSLSAVADRRQGVVLKLRFGREAYNPHTDKMSQRAADLSSLIVKERNRKDSVKVNLKSSV